MPEIKSFHLHIRRMSNRSSHAGNFLYDSSCLDGTPLPGSPTTYLLSKPLNWLEFDPTYPKDSKTLGNYIRKWRMEQGISQIITPWRKCSLRARFLPTSLCLSMPGNPRYEDHIEAIPHTSHGVGSGKILSLLKAQKTPIILGLYWGGFILTSFLLKKSLATFSPPCNIW